MKIEDLLLVSKVSEIVIVNDDTGEVADTETDARYWEDATIIALEAWKGTLHVRITDADFNKGDMFFRLQRVESLAQDMRNAKAVLNGVHISELPTEIACEIRYRLYDYLFMLFEGNENLVHQTYKNMKDTTLGNLPTEIAWEYAVLENA